MIFVSDVVMEEEKNSDQVSMNIEEMETVDEIKNGAEPAGEQKVNGDAAEDEFTVDIKVENKCKAYILLDCL